jgi:hypothetical protein
MFWSVVVKTRIDVDDDVLQAVSEIATNRQTTPGQVLSDLVRKALRSTETASVRNGAPLMPRRPQGSPLITMETVNRLRDEPTPAKRVLGRSRGETVIADDVDDPVDPETWE